MSKIKERKKLALAFVGASMATIALLVYMLCYIAELDSMIMGVVFMGVISGFIVTILIIWEEIKVGNTIKNE